MLNYLVYTLIAAFGWGISPLAGRKALQNYTNTTFIVVRALVIGFLCLTYLIFNSSLFNKDLYYENNTLKIEPLFFTALGSIIVFLGSFCYYTAIYKSSENTILISLIAYISPLIIIALVSTLFFKDKINFKMILGMIIATIGICMVVYLSLIHI